ncbi:hypothetical protein [Scytonema sp. PRP1]|uniref:hypothetical protein n=1 Tax=Scytonema sp. PRP1 TaxID=3120513 RepID=UPI00300CCBC8
MPFNIGRLIELQPFKLEEALKLAEGLEGKVSDPRAVLTEIWSWQVTAVSYSKTLSTCSRFKIYYSGGS